MREVVTRVIRRVRAPGPDEVRALTGIDEAEWTGLARIYPGLPAHPGPDAARRRGLLARRAARALSTGRWNVRWEGEPPPAGPCLFVTAHIGTLQGLRYALRSRGVPVAMVLGPHNQDRSQAIPQDRAFDARYPLDFPHALPSSRVHALRASLSRGSLILAADLPEPPSAGREAEVLGGPFRVDTRPFRLARAVRVPCRAAFATLPAGRLTVTVSSPLPPDEAAATAAFAAEFARVAARSPLDLDGVVYWNRNRE